MTPWELAKDTEHSQQRALFGWANCVAEFGFELAAIPACYSLVARNAVFASMGGNKPCPVPELDLLFAIHNQGHGDRIRGAQAKAEGVKAGVPDVLLPVPKDVAILPGAKALVRYAGLFLELKKLKKGIVSADQYNWQINLQSQGYASFVCKGWIEAANIISQYMGSEVRIS